MPSSNTLWALITGLAVGFAAGREFPRKPHSAPSASAPAAPGLKTAAPAGPEPQAPVAAPAPVPTEIPAGWIKEGEMGATDTFAGLTPAQRYLALKVLNEVPCDCGCSHGSVALCKAQDPGCPRAPTAIAEVVAAARAGGSYDAVRAAVQKEGEAPPPPEKQPAVAEAEPPRRIELAPWTPVRGPKYAKVTIVEFSDFQCPFCARTVPTLEKIRQEYGKDVRIAFRHQPLPFHEHARAAAEAAMAAGAQGKFWQMHDKLFANQQALDRPALERYAQELGLDLRRFKADLDSHRFKEQIDKDSRRGTEIGATGTPIFFINGQQLGGARPFAAFRPIIDAELRKAEELLKKGTPPERLYEAVLAKLPL